MSRSYFYGGGIKSFNNGKKSSGSSNNGDFSKLIQTLELQIATVQNQLSQLLGINNKLIALIGRVEILEENNITVYGINDATQGNKNVYNTNYINETLKNMTINFSDDIHDSQVNKYPYVPTLNAILNIKNIDNIPGVYKLFIEDGNPVAQSNVYSISLCNVYFKRVPYVLDENENITDLNNPTVYGKEYIDKMMPIIYDSKDEFPYLNNVYNTAYLNPILDKISNVYHTTINDTKGSYNVYSCYYINNLPIPNDILFNMDNHISNRQNVDSTYKNVYNTYYIDQWLNNTTNEVNGEVTQFNELKLRLFTESDRITKNKPGTSDFYQLFGDNLQEITLKPDSNKLTIFSRKEPETEDIKLLSLYRPTNGDGNEMNNGVLNIKSLNISNGSSYLYENEFSKELFNDVNDIRYLPLISALDKIVDGETNYKKRIIFGMTHGKIKKGGELDGEIEESSNFSVLTHYVNLVNPLDNYLGFGLNNPMPNLDNVENENILQIFSSNIKCNNALNVTGTLDVGENATLSKDLTVEGSTTLNGQTLINNALNVTGTLDVGENATLSKDLTVRGIIVQSSDIRLKKNIKKIENKDIISKLNPVSFTMQNKQRYGFIAQEVQNVLPELVCKIDDSGFLSVNYIEIIPFLVSKVQSQDKEIKSLREENLELKNKISIIYDKLGI